jgi:hypothetical protein
MIRWHDIAFELSDDLADEAARAWQWLVPEPWTPVLCSKFGGIFLEKADGVFWLECGTGLIERVADDAAAFHGFLKGERDEAWVEQVDDWFLGPLVEQLHAAGKIAGDGQCYGATILPIFEGGVYSVENMFVLSAREWLSVTGSMHLQMRDVPDGGKVRIEVTD